MKVAYRISPSIAIIAIGLCAPLAAHAGGVIARGKLATAIAAMGGGHVLGSVHGLRLEAIGHRNMLEHQ